MKNSSIFLLLIVLFLGSCNEPVGQKIQTTQKALSEEERLQPVVKEALAYCKAHKFNTSYGVLIDMSIHSGKKRMFIYNFKENKIVRSALCAHGCGKGPKKNTGDQPIFGNEEGSLLTSLGKYKIGARSYSQYGINVHYKLHGLESTNSNAYQRIVVLHSHTPLSSIEIYPNHLPMGWSQGCPVTDDETLQFLDQLLSKSKKPVLLWIYHNITAK